MPGEPFHVLMSQDSVPHLTWLYSGKPTTDPYPTCQSTKQKQGKSSTPVFRYKWNAFIPDGLQRLRCRPLMPEGPSPVQMSRRPERHFTLPWLECRTGKLCLICLSIRPSAGNTLTVCHWQCLRKWQHLSQVLCRIDLIVYIKKKLS